MIRKNIKICLTAHDRAILQQVAQSPMTTNHDKFKALVVLYTDVGELGPGKKVKDVAKELDTDNRSIVRVRQNYAQNNCIEDVFRRPEKRNESNNSNDKISVEKKHKKHKGKYIEHADYCVEGLRLQHTKYRVVLTPEEKVLIGSILSTGKHSNRKINRAKILELANEGTDGLAMSDSDISKKLDVSIPTIQRVRKLFVCMGDLEKILNFNHTAAGRRPKIDGAVEAAIVATVCSKPPKGRCNWTLRLLASHIVELGYIDSISHVAVGKTLKKMNLSLGKKKNG